MSWPARREPCVSATSLTTSAPRASSLSDDALSALLNLGYKRMEAFAAVSSAAQKLGSDAKLDILIKASLAELSRKEHAA
ncbi:MAG: hypothetical protein EBV03_13260 [Proteobacteria bacterium]|nr:hypothetical protein [Pseudomonadota bacterium]